MKLIEELFLEKRNVLNKTKRNKTLAAKDAEWLVKLYRSKIDENADDDEIYQYTVTLFNKHNEKNEKIPDLKKKIVQYIKQQMNFEIDSYYRQTVKTFSGWLKHLIPDEKDKPNEIIKLTNWLYFRYRDELRKDRSFVCELVDVVYLKSFNNIETKDITPSYIKKLATNRNVIDIKGKITDSLDDDYILEKAYVGLSEIFEINYTKLSSRVKVDNLIKLLKTHYKFSLGEITLLEVFAAVSFKEQEGETIEQLMFRFTQECKSEFAKLGYSKNSFNKMFERIADKIKNWSGRERDDAKGMLQYITADDMGSNRELQVLVSLLDFLTEESIIKNIEGKRVILPDLKTYRFSNMDIKKMNMLVELFDWLDGIYIKHFPEVYIGSYINAVSAFPEIKNINVHIASENKDFDPTGTVYKKTLKLKWPKDHPNKKPEIKEEIAKITQGNTSQDEGDKEKQDREAQMSIDKLVNDDESYYCIDQLGVYLYELGEDNDPDYGKQTKEGIIILFEDRIKSVAENLNINASEPSAEEEITHIVLMHMIGHWITHWPLIYEFNWEYGYAEDRPAIKEVFAQLITYWCVEKDDCSEDDLKGIFLKYLTPSLFYYSIYNSFLDFINICKYEIIDRLSDIRNFCNFTDYECCNYLKLPENPMQLHEFPGCRCFNLITFERLMDLYNIIKNNPAATYVECLELSNKNNPFSDHEKTNLFCECTLTKK